MSVRGVRWSFRESARRPNPASETSGGGGPPSDARPTEDSFRWSYRGERWHLENNEGGEVSLLSAKLELVPLKDFSTEVRAFMDVNQFMNDATVLLDVTENTLESIVDVVLKKMLTVNEPSTSIVETSRATFMSDRLHMPTRTIQGVCTYDNGDFDYDHSWMCIMCSMPTLLKKRMAVVRLKHPANMGRTCEDVRFLVLVLTPTKEKGTKNAVETGRTFATLFADGEFRRRLWEARSTADFVDELMAHARALSSDQRKALALNGNLPHDKVVDDKKGRMCTIGQGLREDVRRRWSYYISDYVDGVVGPKTLYKTISTTFFLYFGILLPIIAFGVLNSTNTRGKIDVTKCLMSQTIGGLFFAFLGGQPLVILMTTAPLSLYIKVIHDICEDFGFDFMAMYACVGLFNSFFLFLYVIFDVSKIMKWCTRSTEEIFSLFITLAFSVDAGRDVYKEFRLHYMAPECADPSVVVAGSIPSTYNLSSNASTALIDAALGFAPCQRDSSLLFLLLMVGTVWLGVSLYNFNKTPYLQAYLRDLLADYALPVAVVVLSFVGSFVFSDVPAEQFQFVDDFSLKRARVEVLPVYGILGALGLGFALSLLFFMDQNISAAMVNNPSNKLHKGTAYHLDLLVVGLLNAGLSLFGLPWMHGVLPHSPLHARSLADLEERVDQGHVQEVVVRSRETRLTGILSHVLIGLSLLMLPYPLSYIPTAVLDGLFLYMAVTSLIGNQMFERITLLFMEQAAYPPNHYIRRCPQRKIHTFTACQLVQLAVLCFFGFAPWPYVQMVFPVIILLLLPIRHKIITHFVDAKYLASLDGKHQ